MARQPLRLFWNANRADNFTTGTEAGQRDALAAGYQLIRGEAFVEDTMQTGMVPLRLYWNSDRGDNFTTATADGEQSALAAEYQFIRVEGYVYRNGNGEGVVIGSTPDRDFGGGKHGQAGATLERSGLLTVITHVWTNSPFQGFTMGVKVWLTNAQGGVILETAGAGPYGVDGHNTPFGSASDRTEVFTQQFAAEQVANVTGLTIVLFWAPRWRIVEIINHSKSTPYDHNACKISV
jgi:hypothetical protein